MAATINFLGGGFGLPINYLNGSGLAFFGSAGFGNSVAVGAWSGSVYISDGNGVNQGPQLNNITYFATNSGVVQNGTILNLANIANYQSVLNIRFQNSSPVRTQNAKVYFYDRSNILNPPTGVTVAAFPIIHPDTSNGSSGSGSANWQFPAGSSYINMSITNTGLSFSPGQSGYGVNGGSTIDMTHDFYLGISLSPNSIGSKNLAGLWFQTEFL